MLLLAGLTISCHMTPSHDTLISCDIIMSLYDIVMSLYDVMWRHDVTLWRHVTSWRHSMTSYDVTMSLSSDQTSHHSAKLLHNEILTNDLDLWPTTLTYNPSLAKVKVNHLTKNQGHRSKGLAVRVLTHTHRHTHRKTAPILWPRLLTREVKIESCICNKVW